MKKTLLCLFSIVLLISAPGFSQATKKVDRDSFSFEYPATWTIDKEDEDYDPDALFSIDAPDDNGMIMFIIVDLAIDLDEMMEEQEKEVKTNLIKKPTEIISFTKWGNYTGKGKTIKGKLLGVMKGQVNMFICHVGDRTLYLMEQIFDNSIDKIKPELSIISSSFRFK